MKVLSIIMVITLLLINWAITARGDVRHNKINDEISVVNVQNEDWQPEGFPEALILRAVRVEAEPIIDGKADDTAWSQGESITVPLSYGSVRQATLKAVYTDKEVFLLVSWPDTTKDDQHHPWAWDEKQGRYLEGPQIEDSLMVSIEGGCDWTPSLLSGWVYDFDGWLWLAARSDPLGQAVDIDGMVQSRWISNKGFVKYTSRNKKPFWNLKFYDRGPDTITKPWQEINRLYKHGPVLEEVYVKYLPDNSGLQGRGSASDFFEKLPAPEMKQTPHLMGPKSAHAASTPMPVVPQYKPVKLTGDAGDVEAKGRWADGRWTVEFRRTLVTPAGTRSDSIFEGVTQFSILIFDRTERVDESSESGRLFLQFEPAKGVEKE